MATGSTLLAIAENFETRKQTAQKEFHGLAQAIANGKAIGPDKGADILDRAGLSLADLEQEVERLRRRKELATIYKLSDEAEEKAMALRAEIQKHEADFLRVRRDHEEAMAPLVEALNLYASAIARGQSARDELLKDNPVIAELNQELESLRAEQRELREKKKGRTMAIAQYRDKEAQAWDRRGKEVSYAEEISLVQARIEAGEKEMGRIEKAIAACERRIAQAEAEALKGQ